MAQSIEARERDAFLEERNLFREERDAALARITTLESQLAAATAEIDQRKAAWTTLGKAIVRCRDSAVDRDIVERWQNTLHLMDSLFVADGPSTWREHADGFEVSSSGAECPRMTAEQERDYWADKWRRLRDESRPKQLSALRADAERLRAALSACATFLAARGFPRQAQEFRAALAPVERNLERA